MTEAITQTDLAIPVLASLDLKESVEFYTQFLGFDGEVIGDNYAIVKREAIEIHFWKCDDRKIAENTSCYVRVKDVDKYWHAFAKAGLRLKEPVNCPWGMREIYVIDPHGNLIKFGERIT